MHIAKYAYYAISVTIPECFFTLPEHSVFLSTSQNHPFTLTFIKFFILLYVSSSFIMHKIPLCTGGYLGFSVLSMNTSACRLEHLVLKPLNFQLVDSLLNLLSPNCSKIQRSLNTVSPTRDPAEIGIQSHFYTLYGFMLSRDISLQTSVSDDYYLSE